MNPPGTMSDRAIRRWLALLEPLRRYHRYSAVGLENIPDRGGVIIAINHSLASYDAFLLGHAIYHHNGRIPIAMADRNFFRVPALGRVALAAGLHEGSPERGAALLSQGHMLVVAPGGTREALRPSSEKREIRWDRRKGFVRLAFEANVPIVLAACPAADDIFEVKESRLTKLVYKRTRFPLPLTRGGLKKVRLTHHIDPPVYPEGDVDTLHARLCERMSEMLALPREG